ncbi:uncharacterized protein [Fopius arisanus]|uniref:Uncharacterized protein isoform X1 n=1 Tax=Fopius arisanus TaxID=64838 RepID=A0A9R1TS41_9HYME|nr:PREDICTED: uncharacterized protein LOC105273795 isoform X1 [Fopius arisanus]XP_011314733.1 PREDICTED: uncharacterized protein LOC105273795 isoform X2 [Fopius arisanus]
MEKSLGKLLFVCWILLLNSLIHSQDIVFPVDEDHTHLGGSKGPLMERIPVYIPGRCPENMYLYPGSGNKSTWICDCKPGYLYFPLNGTCHAAFRKGPCNQGEYAILWKNEVIPRCASNPCLLDGSVWFRGGCHHLNSRGPCQSGVVRVNYDTYQLDCLT